jgi:hypothetical protein
MGPILKVTNTEKDSQFDLVVGGLPIDNFYLANKLNEVIDLLNNIVKEDPLIAIRDPAYELGPSLNSESSRKMGYTGDSCPQCLNFTMVRTGTCETCRSCGHNEGCA